jgi:RHS repeat-associated protein
LRSSINVLSAVTYNGDNNVKGWTWSNGSVYQRGYDSFGRLASYPLGNPSGTGAAAGLTRTIGYDNAARILSYTHSSATGAQAQFNQGFTYDDLGQLNTNTQGSASYSYSYDASGNRTLRVVGGAGFVNTIAPTSNRVTQTQGGGTTATTTSYSYDNAGNMLADGTATYGYSDRGRMSSATIGSNTVVYKYNGLNQRTSKSGPTALIGTGAAYYAYDEAGQLTGEYDANLNPIHETVYLGSTPVAVLKQTGAAASSSLQTSSANVYADHIDTPRVITRSSDNAVLWRWDTAEAFGATAPNQNPNGIGVFAFSQRFPGQILDIETGNFYNWHRDYKPSLGRYAQSDPIGLGGGINTYQYVGGNPSSYVDPQGLMGGGGGGSAGHPGPPTNGVDSACVRKYLADYYGAFGAEWIPVFSGVSYLPGPGNVREGGAQQAWTELAISSIAKPAALIGLSRGGNALANAGARDLRSPASGANIVLGLGMAGLSLGTEWGALGVGGFGFFFSTTANIKAMDACLCTK